MNKVDKKIELTKIAALYRALGNGNQKQKKMRKNKLNGNPSLDKRNQGDVVMVLRMQ